MSVDSLIRKALDSGIELELVDGSIQVIGRRAVVHQWRDKLRQHRDEIIQHLTAAANDPEPSQDPSAWRELASEYHAHHFLCEKCISAAQGRGLRCGTGSALWLNYQTQI